jgi:hypothetical protein
METPTRWKTWAAVATVAVLACVAPAAASTWVNPDPVHVLSAHFNLGIQEASRTDIVQAL